MLNAYQMIYKGVEDVPGCICCPLHHNMVTPLDSTALTLYCFDFHQVSNGAVAMAKTTLEQLLVRCATPLKDEEKTEELLAAQDKSFHMVTHDLVREVTSPNSTVRKQAMHSLQVLAHVTGKSVTVIMEPHKEVKPRTECNDKTDP